MKQEDKDLLLKDLCARLPYAVKGNFQNSDDKLLRSITITYGNLKPNGMVMTGDIKPYLFPLSSMTEEQEMEYDATFDTIVYEDGRKDSVMTYKSFDWLNKNNFDYRGLIPMGLAIDATNLNIY